MPVTLQKLLPRSLPLLLLFASSWVYAQPMLVADFDNGLEKESATRIVAVADESLLFLVDKPDIPELWVTDGTPEGTRFWSETCPGTCTAQSDSSLLNNIQFDGSRSFWIADDGIHGNEIWTSDGTAEGTRMVADLCPGRCSSMTSFFTMTLIDGRLYFSAVTEAEGTEPWVTDGTKEGTYSLGDFYPGPEGSMPHAFLAYDGGVIFRTYQENFKTVWRWTDGTPENTRLFVDLCEGDECPGYLIPPAVLDDAVYQLVQVDSENRLYRMRTGTAPEQIFSCISCFDPFHARLLPGKDRLLIQGLDTLYAVDNNGVTALPAPSPDGGDLLQAHVVGDTMELALVRESSFEWTLFRLDGASWSEPLAELEGEVVAQVFGDHLRLVHYDFFQTFVWRSDGTAAGTTRVGTIAPDLDIFGFFGSAALGDQMLFKTVGADEQLWRTDGTVGGSQPLFGQGTRPRSSNPSFVTSLGDRAIFGTYPEEFFLLGEILTTDGTAEGTEQLIPEVNLLSAETVQTLEGARIFAAARDDSAWVLPWLTDGTPAGTRQLGFDDGGPAYPREPVDYDGALFFLADRGYGQQMWRTDGTASGTEMVFDLNPEWFNGFSERFFAYPRELHRITTETEDLLVFVASQNDTGLELWQSDGTAAGTELVADLRPGSPGSEPTSLTVVGDRLFFIANDGISPVLWSWRPGTPPRPLWVILDVLSTHAVSNLFLFFEQQSESVALLRSNGEPFGTAEIAELDASIGSEFVVAGDPSNERLYFVASDERGAELWTTDGTSDGTYRVADLWPGSRGSYPHNLKVVDDALYFSADDGRSGQELWRLSLATETLTQVADVVPGEPSSAPRETARVGDRLLFSAETPETGRELWSVSADTPECVPTEFAQCLRNGRFSVSVRWKAPTAEQELARVLPGTDDSAFFWFFNETNLELIVKVLDGTSLNDHHWLFYGSLSNVEYWIEAKDHQTGTTKVFHNPPLELCGDADTQAFPEGTSSGLDTPVVNHRISTRSTDKTLNCAGTETALCLLDRFLVSVDWQTSEGSGTGTAIPFTDETGLFWFFNDLNIELAVKVLDARDINDRFWVFFGALSDVAYQVTVTDTETGAQKIYSNPQGNICGQSDTDAFPGS